MDLDVAAVTKKLRRALRNKTGVTLTNADLRALASVGVFHMVAKAEADELVSEFNLDPGPPPEAEPRAFSTRTLAERWSCSEQLIRNMIAREELRAFRYGNLIRITAEAVAEVEARR